MFTRVRSQVKDRCLVMTLLRSNCTAKDVQALQIVQKRIAVRNPWANREMMMQGRLKKGQGYPVETSLWDRCRRGGNDVASTRPKTIRPVLVCKTRETLNSTSSLIR